MKNIFKIFIKDLRGISRNFFALVIALGLCILPALYAWFNIYANNDPYGSTGNIKIAVVNLDKGGKDTENKPVNMGDNIIYELKGKDSIGWVFESDKEKAVEGLKSGEYYATLVIDENFTTSMYQGIYGGVDNPLITYYVNDKKNAVATKITDTAVSTLQNSINKTYIKTVSELIFGKTNDATINILDSLEDDDTVDKIISNITQINDDLKIFISTIDAMSDGNENIENACDDAKNSINNGNDAASSQIKALESLKKEINSTKQKYQAFNDSVTNALSEIKNALGLISQDIENAKLSDSAKTLSDDFDKVVSDANLLYTDLNNLNDLINKFYISSVTAHVTENKTNLKDELTKLNNQISLAISNINTAMVLTKTLTVSYDKNVLPDNVNANVNAIVTALNDYSSTIEQIELMYSSKLAPQINSVFDTMKESIDNVEEAINNITKLSPQFISILENVIGTLSDVDSSMSNMKNSISAVSYKLDSVIGKLDDLKDNQKLVMLLSMLSIDTDKLASYFAEPVKVKDNYLYEIKNYGSSVTPFYTVLAIWVGMTILVSLLKVQPDKEGLENPMPHQLYFGRYIIFFVLSQLQTAIIVFGNLYLLDVQCVDKTRFFIASAITSATFSLIVYTLTVSFGDIGKALAVIIMVIQIAGSGGTYPIEALPEFFQKVYIFFPFPYAIDAIRECIGGMYSDRYEIMLLKQGIFIIAALFVGLLVRKPFIHFNHFIEERMEDTKMF